MLLRARSFGSDQFARRRMVQSDARGVVSKRDPVFLKRTLDPPVGLSADLKLLARRCLHLAAEYLDPGVDAVELGLERHIDDPGELGIRQVLQNLLFGIIAALTGSAGFFSSCADMRAQGWVFCRVAMGISARCGVGLDIGAADRHMRAWSECFLAFTSALPRAGPVLDELARIRPILERREPNRNDPGSLRRSTCCGQRLWRIFFDRRTAMHVTTY